MRIWKHASPKNYPYNDLLISSQYLLHKELNGKEKSNTHEIYMRWDRGLCGNNIEMLSDAAERYER